MKFLLTFKTPDVIDQLTDECEKKDLEVVKKFVKYDEYITIEFDSDNGTARVIPIK